MKLDISITKDLLEFKFWWWRSYGDVL
jgi:hypothetical protein